MKTEFDTFIETLKILGFTECHANQLQNNEYKIIFENTLKLVGVSTPIAYTVFAFFQSNGEYYPNDWRINEAKLEESNKYTL